MIRLAQLAGLTLIALSCASADAQGWPMRGFDSQNRNRSPHYGVKHARPAWQLQQSNFAALGVVVDAQGALWTSMFRATPEESALWKVGPDGSIRWKALLRNGKNEALVTFGPPAVSVDGRAFVGWSARVVDYDTKAVYCHAFDTDGRQLWMFEVTIPQAYPGHQEPLLGPDGTLYIGLATSYATLDDHPSIVALDSDTGQLKWRWVSPHQDDFFWSPALSDEGKLYLGSRLGAAGAGFLYCVDAASGTMDWYREIGYGCEAPVTVGDDGGVYATLEGYAVCQKYSPTGELLWEYDLSGRDVRAPLAVFEGKVYIPVSSGGGLHIVDEQTGKLIRILDQGRYITGTAVDRSGTVFFHSESQLTAYDRFGNLLWREYAGPATTWMPVVIGHNGLLLSCNSIYLRAFESRYAPADLNCDGSVNAFDLDPFVQVLTDFEGYELSHVACDPWLADVNRDGSVNGFDIEPFVETLAGP